MRKIIIILTAVAVTGLAYWGYIRLTGAGAMEPPTTHTAKEMDMPEATGDARRSGQPIVHGAEQSYYITRDPVTRQMTRVFGFSRLVNPGQQSARWQVEKPYIIFYESAFQCRIEADMGLIQTERAGSTVTPQDGQLEGNVVIHISPHADSEIAETRLLLDDLLFSSERTEFSTDGPVRVISSQVDLAGQGLLLLINAADGQIEYLHILDLEFLRLKDFVQTDERKAAPLVSATDDAETQIDKPQTPSTIAAADDGSEKIDGNSRLYQCTIDDNVMIRYGDRIVVAGADQINIRNILFARQDDRKPQPDMRAAAQNTGPAPAIDTIDREPTTEAELLQTEIAARPSIDTLLADSAQRDDSADVVVTCEGGILVKPMLRTNAAASLTPITPAIEMNGTPLRIEQIDPLSSEKTIPMAYCGLLMYDTGTEVLELFRDAWENDIVLGSPAGRIKTHGPVLWDRKANQAQIVGPGMVYFDGNGDESTDAGQIAFAGQMELFFADAPAQQSSLQLTGVNLTGGMSAQLRGDGALSTAADTAKLTFGPENALTSAHLEGAVRFENADGPSSLATADTAVFHFGDDRQLARADLSGDVRLASDSGQLHTSEATIAFAADETGTIQPSRFDTVAAATLETRDATDAKQPPARFEARSISYDLQTGSGQAAGPVRFVFYQPADPNGSLLTEYWPVEITADGDAEFIAGADRQIETIIFKRNVSGIQTLQYAAYTEQNAFSADTMIVKLGRNTEGTADIQSITLRDGDVYAEFKRTHETLRLAMTRLSCQEIIYDRTNQRLIATGPGEIAVDNSNAEASASSGGLDMSGPSYAKIEGFDRIEWTAADRRIVADGDADVLQVSYIPLIDGVPSRLIRAAAGRVEIELAEEADGRTELAQLTAKDHVFFEEEGKHILEGYTLLYNAANDGWLTITGTDDRPCMADGARVPYIHYNVSTGQLETQLSTIPGAVTFPQ